MESFQECGHSDGVCLRVRGRSKGSDDFSLDDCGESGSWMTGFVMEEILWIGRLFVWLNVQYSSGVEAVALVIFQIQKCDGGLALLHREFDGCHPAIEMLEEGV